MKEIKTKGIVLDEMPIGEFDKRLTLYTEELGKVYSFAKGARKTKSKLLSSTQVFTYSEFILFATNKTVNVKQANYIDNFYKLRNDIIKISYASYLSELLKYVSVENQPNINLLHLLLLTLKIMEKDIMNLSLLISTYELKLMSYSGFTPHLYNCIECGENINLKYFNPLQGGMVCSKCYDSFNPYIIELSKGTKKALEYILQSNLRNVYKFNVSSKVLEELIIISRNFVDYQLETKFKILDYIKELTKFESR